MLLAALAAGFTAGAGLIVAIGAQNAPVAWRVLDAFVAVFMAVLCLLLLLRPLR